MKSMRQIRHGIMLLCCCVWFNSHVLASSHTMPNIQTWKTSQGVRVYFAQRTRLPMLDINLVFNAGSSRDPQTQSGLSQLTASLLNQGTTKLSVDQIANQFGHYGSVYEAESTQDWLAVHLRSLTQAEALSSSVALLNQLVTTSTFNQEAVNRKKSQAMIALKYEIQNPTKLVQQVFLKALYGTGPYGHNPLGTPEGVNAITVEAIKSFYHRYVVSKNACIVMVGDLSLSQAKAVSEKLLNGLPQGHAAPELTFTEMQKKNRVHLSSKAKQTTVILGYLGITRESPDYFPLLVGNHMMGGMPLSSILFDVIRNHNGLAYSVSSVLNPLQQPGPWFVLLQTRANQSQQAIESVNTIIQSMKVRPITKKELNTVKANLVGSFPIAIATNDGLLEVITRIAFYHRPLDYMSTFKDHVNAVTADDIHHAFQHLLLQHTPIIVTVGPGKDHAT